MASHRILNNLDKIKFNTETGIGYLRNNLVPFQNTDDLNLVNIPFVYFVQNTQNRPPTGSGFVFTMSSGSYSVQLALGNASNVAYYRRKSDNVWAPWVSLI